MVLYFVQMMEAIRNKVTHVGNVVDQLDADISTLIETTSTVQFVESDEEDDDQFMVVDESLSLSQLLHPFRKFLMDFFIECEERDRVLDGVNRILYLDLKK